MSVKIYLDMDGTLFDLYNKPDWLDDLENENPGVFKEYGTNHGLLPFVKKDTLQETILNMIDRGFTFGIISWLPRGASPEYSEICRAEKLEWLKENLPMIEEISLTPYGIEKQKAIQKRASRMYLVDDNAEILNAWATQKQRFAYLVDENYSVIDVLNDILEIES